MKSPLKIVFIGTADLARASLAALQASSSFAVAAVVSQPDKPQGRDLQVRPTPVKAAALARKLPVLQPRRARDETFIAQLRELGPELIVVAAYGQILPPSILDLPRFGCLNVHTSLLPKYRGAAPIQWAILNGEEETGVTIMKMDAGLDTGGMVSQRATPIAAADDAQTLHDRLAALGADLLVRTIPDYVDGRLLPQPQPDQGASYARKISKEDGRINWTQPAQAVWNQVRALTPWPGAFTSLDGDGTSPSLLKIWRSEVDLGRAGVPGVVLEAGRNAVAVACGRHALRLLEVQRPGGRRMAAADFIAGHPLRAGEILH